eukprot:scaffold32086_cov183-Amphora_coffeaeformis.AAC.15
MGESTQFGKRIRIQDAQLTAACRLHVENNHGKPEMYLYQTGTSAWHPIVRTEKDLGYELCPPIKSVE